MKKTVLENPTVLVLMATYNGEKYIKEQIESIINQKNVVTFIKIYDDQSKDSTVSIIEREISKYPGRILYVINNKNKGFTYNFLDAIFNESKSNYNYYSLSDQDDVWLPNKLQKAISMIENKTEPILYCSNLKVVDEQLVQIGYLNRDNLDCRLNCNNYIFQNLATGCTTVFNNQFKKRVLEYYPQNVYLHDYWLFLIAAYTCHFIYDKNSYILYRQHSGNQIGLNKSLNLIKIWNKIFKSQNHPSVLCQQLLIGYSNYLSEESINILSHMAFYKHSIKYKNDLLFKTEYRKPTHNFLKQIRLLFNKY